MKRTINLLLVLVLLAGLFPAGAAAVKHLHQWVEYSRVEATCVLKGWIRYRCSVCGKEKEETIPALAKSHKWGKWRVIEKPTCIGEGQEMRTCSRCGETEYEELKPTGKHTWKQQKILKEATCAATGVGVWQCTVCGKKETRTIAKKKQHSYGEWTQHEAPTCVKKGRERRTCKVCGLTQFRDLPKTGRHSFGAWKETKAPTCSEKGRETRTCKVCGLTQARNIDATRKHKFTVWKTAKAASCGAEGTEKRTCTTCGKEETRSLPALGHDWDEGVVTKPAGYLEPGEILYTCRRDSSHTKTEPAALREAPGETPVMDLIRGVVPQPEADAELKIVSQPQDGSISMEDGGTLLLTVEVTGGAEPYTYEWKQSPCRADTVAGPLLGLFSRYETITGAGNPSYEASAGNMGYCCTITDAAGNRVTSDQAYVYWDLYIQEQPESRNIYSPDPDNPVCAVLSCTAGGGVPFGSEYVSPYAYFWMNGNGDVQGTEPTMRTFAEGEYWCVVQDSRGNEIRTETVTVYSAEPLHVVAQSEDQSLKEGETLDLFAQFGGGVPPYEAIWVTESGADTETRQTADDTWSTSVTGTDTGWQVFYCTVSDQMGEGTLAEIIITPYRDPLTIVRTESDPEVTNEKKASLFVEVTDGTDPYTYTLLNDGTEQDTKSTHGTSASFSVDEPGWYAIRVEDKEGRTAQTEYMEVGDSRLTIVEQPRSVSIRPLPGELSSVTFTCVAAGNPKHPLTYQWQGKGSDGWKSFPEGPKNSITQEEKLTDTFYYMLRKAYRCIVKDTVTGQEVISDEAAVSWPMEVTGYQNGRGTSVNLSVQGGQAPYKITCYRRRRSFYSYGNVVQEDFDLAGHVEITGGDHHHSMECTVSGLSRHSRKFYSANYFYTHYSYYFTVTDNAGQSVTCRIRMESDNDEMGYTADGWTTLFFNEEGI